MFFKTNISLLTIILVVFVYAFFYLCSIGRIQNIITFDTNAQLMYALITTSLDFCKCILYNLQTTRLAGKTDTKPGSTYFNATAPCLR